MKTLKSWIPVSSNCEPGHIHMRTEKEKGGGGQEKLIGKCIFLLEYKIYLSYFNDS